MISAFSGKKIVASSFLEQTRSDFCWDPEKYSLSDFGPAVSKSPKSTKNLQKNKWVLFPQKRRKVFWATIFSWHLPLYSWKFVYLVVYMTSHSENKKLDSYDQYSGSDNFFREKKQMSPYRSHLRKPAVTPATPAFGRGPFAVYFHTQQTALPTFVYIALFRLIHFLRYTYL